jgi:hypothetical protein
LIVIKESAEEIAGREAESALRKGKNTTISLVLCVGRSSPVVGSRFHLQRMLETGAGARQPWPGRRFGKVRNQGERGDGDREKDDDKWRRHEK